MTAGRATRRKLQHFGHLPLSIRNYLITAAGLGFPLVGAHGPKGRSLG
jgi:hypothetical protein